MRIRQLAVAGAAITTFASLAGGAAPALAASTVSCSTKGSTIATTNNARVFKVTVRKIPRLYGCATVTKRISYLGRTGGEGIDPSVIAVAGPRVAYVRTFCGEGGCLLRVFVYDLKQRKEGLG